MTNATLDLTYGVAPKRLTFGKNTMFDIVFIIGGGLIFYLPVLWYFGETRLHDAIPFDWAFWGNQIVSMPHVWATYARMSRKIGERKVSFVFGFPAYFCVVAILLTAAINGSFLMVMTAVNVWQSFHYCRQVYGVGRFFGRPEGETELERRLSFWAYHAAMPLFIIGRWNLLYIYWRGQPSDAIIPVAFPAPLMTSLWILAGVACAIGLWAEVLKYRRAKHEYDCSGLLNLIVYYGIHWYGFLSLANFMAGFLAVTIFHAMQYLSITWRFEAQQTSTKVFASKALKFLPRAASFAAFWVALYFVGDFVQSHVFTLGDGFYPKFTGTCLSSISAHHYLVDTLLWNRKAGV